MISINTNFFIHTASMIIYTSFPINCPISNINYYRHHLFLYNMIWYNNPFHNSYMYHCTIVILSCLYYAAIFETATIRWKSKMLIWNIVYQQQATLTYRHQRILIPKIHQIYTQPTTQRHPFTNTWSKIFSPIRYDNILNEKKRHNWSIGSDVRSEAYLQRIITSKLTFMLVNSHRLTTFFPVYPTFCSSNTTT